MTVFLPLLLRLLPYLIGAGLLISGWLYADRGWCNHACTKAVNEAATLKAEKTAAIQRATDLALLYARTAEEADANARQARNLRSEQGRALSERARGLGTAPVIRISGDALRVQLDATNYANSAPAPIRDKAPAVAVPDIAISEAQLTTFVVDAAMAYLDAKSLHLACVNFYEGLRANTLPESP